MENGTDRDGRQEQNGELGCCGFVLMGVSIFMLIIFFPFSLICSLKIVQEYERAVIFRLGRVLSGGAKGPGLFFLMPCVDMFRCVDMRTFSYDIPPQEILSRDSVTVKVDAVIYARIFDATMSIICIENAQSSTRLLAATTLRNVLGTKPLSEILTDRESIAQQMQHILDEGTQPWGVKIERVEMKDVRLPVNMQRAMAAEAEATRDAKAKVILAEGEMKASHSLKEAADIMAQSPAAMQIRYLQTINSIAAENNSTIIFPLPIDMLPVATKSGGGGSYSKPAIQAPPIRKSRANGAKDSGSETGGLEGAEENGRGFRKAVSCDCRKGVVGNARTRRLQRAGKGNITSVGVDRKRSDGRVAGSESTGYSRRHRNDDALDKGPYYVTLDLVEVTSPSSVPMIKTAVAVKLKQIVV